MHGFINDKRTRKTGEFVLLRDRECGVTLLLIFYDRTTGCNTQKKFVIIVGEQLSSRVFNNGYTLTLIARIKPAYSLTLRDHQCVHTSRIAEVSHISMFSTGCML